MIDDIFKTKPDAINEQGTKFWLDKDTTNYAKNKGLIGVQVLFVENKEGIKTRIMTQNGEVVYDNQGWENMAVHIDIMAINNRAKGARHNL